MRLSKARRYRVARPAVDTLEHLNLVSILPSLAAVPERIDAPREVLPIEAARIDQPSPVPGGSPKASSFASYTSAPTADMSDVVSLGVLDRAGLSALVTSAKTSLSSDLAFSITTSTVSDPSSQSGLRNLFDSDPEGLAQSGSDGSRLDAVPAAAAQARSSVDGAISHGSVPMTITSTAPTAAPTTAKQPVATVPTAGAMAALGTALAQSVGDGVRPMTMSAAPASSASFSAGRVQKPGMVHPDMGSGGNPSLPPSLKNMTFALTQPDPVNQPGVYVPANNLVVPISASCGLTATSPNPQNPIVSWTWSGGSSYSGYDTNSAANSPDVPMPAPVAPGTTSDSYGFIVTPVPGNSYSITVNVVYQDGTKNQATLNFTTCGPPTGTLAKKNAGTFFTGTQPGTTQLTARFNSDIQISMSAQLGNSGAGQFMILQIINSMVIQFYDANGVPYLLANDGNYAGYAGTSDYDGPLVDSPAGQLGQTLRYWDPTLQVNVNAPNGSFWRLPDENGNTSFPAGTNGPPFMSDSPFFTTPAGAQSLSLSESFSDYLMFKSNIQGSVWYALSTMTWSWSASTQAGAGIVNGAPTVSGASNPSGSACFPPWVNWAGNLLTNGAVQED